MNGLPVVWRYDPETHTITAYVTSELVHTEPVAVLTIPADPDRNPRNPHGHI